MKLSREQLAALRAAYAAGAAKSSMSEPTRSRCRDAVAALDELIGLRERHRKLLAAAEAIAKLGFDWASARQWSALDAAIQEAQS